jgi:hypothetical protein
MKAQQVRDRREEAEMKEGSKEIGESNTCVQRCIQISMDTSLMTIAPWKQF